MLSFKVYWENQDYRGEHKAPNKETGSPLYDLKDIYPDIYTLSINTAARYYGHGEKDDAGAISIIKMCHNKPNLKIKIYRSVPIIETENTKNIKTLTDKLKNANRSFPKVDWIEMDELGYKYEDIPKYVEYLYNKLEDLKKNKEKKISINQNDWVTISKSYATQHGRSSLLNKYKILTKNVPAKHLYTDGNSIYEFGYDPS